MTRYFGTTLLVATALTAICRADSLPPLPPGAVAGSTVILSMGASTAPGAVPATSATVNGKPVALPTKDGLSIAHSGYDSSSASVEFKLPAGVAGIYDVWTAFMLGGIATQSFSLKAGSQTLSERANWTQSNGESWKLDWRKASSTATIYPQDRRIVVDESGNASGHKVIVAVALVRIGELPTGIDERGASLRSAVASWAPKIAARRYYVLESSSAELANRLYVALAGLPEAMRTSSVVQTFYGDAAKSLAMSVGSPTLPALVAMDGSYDVLGIATGADTAKRIDQVARATQFTPMSAAKSDAGTYGAALAAGVPASWLSTDTWAGPGGLSLYGVDAEATARPFDGDPVVIERFDTSICSRWRTLPAGADGVAILDADTGDYVWSRGTAYTCLYLRASKPRSVVLHVAQTGIKTLGWLEREPLSFDRDKSADRCESPARSAIAATTSKTDQGATVVVPGGPSEGPISATLPLKTGWNRLLLKLVMRHSKGERFALASRIKEPDGSPVDGLTAGLRDPDSPAALHSEAMRLQPLVTTTAPFNLAYPGARVSLNITLRRLSTADETAPTLPLLPFAGRLAVTVRNYTGNVVSATETGGTFPCDANVAISKPLPTGYYSVELKLLAPNGSLIAAYPPDGFSVIGGTVSQKARADSKKMAVTYYFMQDGKADTLYFPYMERLGIYRSIGGNPGPATELYRDAASRGLRLGGELWDFADAARVKETVTLDSPFVDTFKQYNEVDIVPRVRGTAQHWVDISKLHYDAVKAVKPAATVLSASLARPGADPWFRDCLTAGLDSYVDAWDVHCYPQSPPMLEGTMSNSRNETELGVLKAYSELGRTNTKPFWIGETGARASHGLDARRWQADTVAKMVACANSRADFQKIGFLVPWWYSRSESKMGDIEVAHMPAEASYYTASALIDGFPYKRIDYGRSVQAAHFGPTTMLWSTDVSRQVALRLDQAQQWLAVDVVGDVSRLAVSHAGMASVGVSTSPVYIIAAKDYRRLTAF